MPQKILKGNETAMILATEKQTVFIGIEVKPNDITKTIWILRQFLDLQEQKSKFHYTTEMSFNKIEIASEYM